MSSAIPTPSAVPAPAAEERIPTLDLLRGLAVLGILPANMPVYSTPTDWMVTPGSDSTGLDRWAVVLTLFFVNGKFITLLSILFGAGLVLQADRARQAGKGFAWHYVWRMFLLFLIGLVHALLIWFGDILTSYAFVGLAAMLLSRLGTRWMLGLAAACLTWVYGLMIVSGIAVSVWGFDLAPGGPPPSASTSGEPGIELPTMERFGRQLTEHFSRENQLRVYLHGSFGELVLDRVLHLAFYMILFWTILFWYLLACFLLGAVLLRNGVFHDAGATWRGPAPGWQDAMWRDRDRPSPIPRWLVLVGLGMGVPLHVAAVVCFLDPVMGVMCSILNMLGALAQSLGYLGLVLLWARTDWCRWLQLRFQAVGRLALSNYLSQSLICTFLFYGHGLGWFGSVGTLAGLGVVLAIWIAELAISSIWLRYFRIGPVEWIWRSLVDGKPRPFLRSTVFSSAAA